MIEVNVKRGYDLMMMLMLQASQLFGKLPDVVIVDDGKRADDVFVGSGHMHLIQLGTNQVAEGFRTAGITTPFNQPVELFEQVGFDGNADAGQFAHGLASGRFLALKKTFTSSLRGFTV